MHDRIPKELLNHEQVAFLVAHVNTQKNQHLKPANNKKYIHKRNKEMRKSYNKWKQGYSENEN